MAYFVYPTIGCQVKDQQYSAISPITLTLLPTSMSAVSMTYFDHRGCVM
ncbi:MAG: hypothetical protein AAGC85_15675 [Bacteroidota bacterium]